jgi:uncharacterized protein (DUF1499 family)
MTETFTTATTGPAPEPARRTSRTATIAAALGIAGPSLTLVGIALVQLGAPPMAGFGLFQLGILSGLLAFFCGGVAFLLTRGGVGGRDRAWTGLGLGLLMIAVIGASVRPGIGVPPINDITTNLADPPGYAAVPASHANHGRDMSYPPAFVSQVEVAYPDLVPIRVGLGPEGAYRLALGEAKDLGWKITHADSSAGLFEAEETTWIFRFVDDVSVRVRTHSEGGSTIDVRSKSRDGRGDLGANAARIRRLAARVADADVASAP